MTAARKLRLLTAEDLQLSRKRRQENCSKRTVRRSWRSSSAGSKTERFPAPPQHFSLWLTFGLAHALYANRRHRLRRRFEVPTRSGRPCRWHTRCCRSGDGPSGQDFQSPSLCSAQAPHRRRPLSKSGCPHCRWQDLRVICCAHLRWRRGEVAEAAARRRTLPQPRRGRPTAADATVVTSRATQSMSVKVVELLLGNGDHPRFCSCRAGSILAPANQRTRDLLPHPGRAGGALGLADASSFGTRGFSFGTRGFSFGERGLGFGARGGGAAPARQERESWYQEQRETGATHGGHESPHQAICNPREANARSIRHVEVGALLGMRRCTVNHNSVRGHRRPHGRSFELSRLHLDGQPCRPADTSSLGGREPSSPDEPPLPGAQKKAAPEGAAPVSMRRSVGQKSTLTPRRK